MWATLRLVAYTAVLVTPVSMSVLVLVLMTRGMWPVPRVGPSVVVMRVTIVMMAVTVTVVMVLISMPMVVVLHAGHERRREPEVETAMPFSAGGVSRQTKCDQDRRGAEDERVAHRGSPRNEVALLGAVPGVA